MSGRQPDVRARTLTCALLLGAVACDGGGSGGADMRSRSLQAVMGSGVAECDSYLTAYESCINSVVTGTTERATALQGLEQTKASWALRSSTEEQEILARMCVQAERALAENSCSWSPIGTGSGGAGSGGGGGASGGGPSSGGAPGSGGSGGGSCTVQSAQQISSAPGVSFTLAANACFKVNQASWNAGKIKLQGQTGGTAPYPLGFTWFQNSGASCQTAGTPAAGTFAAAWSEPLVPGGSATLAASCPVVFSLSGSAAQTAQLTYFYQ